MAERESGAPRAQPGGATVRLLGGGLLLIYAGLTPLHLLMLRGTTRTVMATLSVSSVLLLLVGRHSPTVADRAAAARSRC